VSPAPAAAAAAPKDHVAARATGLFLFMMGLMGLMIGGIMSGLCLIANGIICSGTMVGTIGNWGLLLGGAGFALGLLLFIPANKAHRAAQKVRLEQMRARSEEAQARAEVRERMLVRAELGEPAAGPIASKCPECGAPVEPGAKECDYCGQTFV
jgi:hypothetical protein